MRNWLKTIEYSLIVTVVFLCGCESVLKPSALRCRYRPGEVEKVRLTSSALNKVWVEMPQKETAKPNLRDIQREIVLRSEVETVEEDGSAVMKVTFEQVNLSVKSDVGENIKINKYISNAQETVTDWSGEPKLAGESYKIEIAPDTTVKAVMGLEELRKKLNIKEDDKGIVAGLINEDNIKRYHEREFIRYSPAKVSVKNKTALAVPGVYGKNVELPDVMIKAQAIKKKYKAGHLRQQGGSEIITVSIEGEALHMLPEGMAEPKQPNNFGQSMIKSMSNLHDLKITGQGTFDLTSGKVLSEEHDVDCTLIILEKDVGLDSQNKKEIKDSRGVLFTLIKLQSKSEVIE